ncbi:hypothetical protein GCM10009868_35370 [Terrabacter aerolatus]|uniref:Uncharacterized protein n=1 Tax=Terrabacter aerolatus TaxID=422442 RepID=A0A512CW70_9MICO|nr:hypothetical protein TAE01_02890 [Terrabacter aerolatus]
METFRREGRTEVKFSRGMVGVYLALGVMLLVCGLALIGMAVGVVSPGTGTADGSAVPGAIFALVGLFILGLGIGQARPTDTPVVADAEGVHVQGKCVPWSVISGFGTTLQGNALDKSHLVATILVDPSTVDAWAAQRRSAGGRRSRLYAPGVVGDEGICLPYNLAVGAEPLSQALEAIRLDVVGVSG